MHSQYIFTLVHTHATISQGVMTLWHQRKDVVIAVAVQLSLQRLPIAGTDRSSIVWGVALRKLISGKTAVISDKRCSSHHRTGSLHVCLQVRKRGEGESLLSVHFSVSMKGRGIVFVCVCDCLQGWAEVEKEIKVVPCHIIHVFPVVFWLTSTKEAFI